MKAFNHRAWPAVAAIVLAGYYCVLAKTRLVDGDEGYFLYAARLVAEGQLPYRDFFFPQMPLTALLWGGFHTLAGGSLWVTGRLLAAAVAWGAAVVFWLILSRRSGTGLPRMVLMAMFLLSDMGLEWAVTVKTMGLANLLLLSGLGLLGLAMAPAGSRRRASGFLFFSGLLAGGALLTRLTVLPALVVMAAGAALAPAGRLRFAPARMAVWMAGFLIALTPLVLLWSQAPQAFGYDNWSYHTLGDAQSFGAHLRQNLGMTGMKLVTSPAWLIAIFAVMRMAARRRLRSRFDGVLLFGFAGLCIAAILPQRAYLQYYALATPWVLLLAAPTVTEWLQTLAGRWGAPGGRARCMAAAGLIGLALLVESVLSLGRHWPVGNLAASEAGEMHKEDYKLGMVRHLNRRIDAIVPPGALLLTWWPGYAVDTQAHVAPGLENQFGQRVSFYESDAVARGLKILPDSALKAMIRERRPEVIVVGIWAGMENRQGPWAMHALVEAAGYRPVESYGRAVIYDRSQFTADSEGQAQ